MNNEPRFNYQDIDPKVNKPDLQKWVDEDQMFALVDEEKGGIIGYINSEHIDEITGLLNDATTHNQPVDLLTDERRLDMLCSALEGGSNYWYYLPDLSVCKKYQASGDTDCGYIMKAVIAGESIPVHDYETVDMIFNPDGDFLGILDMESIRKGEELMHQQQPQHFADIVSENDDAITADVWFQYCVLGGIVFG